MKYRRAFVGLLAGITLTACVSSPNLNSFQKFAAAGSAYEAALDETIDAAIISNIDSNSVMLMKGRDSPKSSDTEENIDLPREFTKQNELVVKTSKSLSELRKQNKLLADYFDALGKLAGYEGTGGLTTSAQSAANSLKELHPSLENMNIEGASPSDVLGSIVPIAVAKFRSDALTAELEKNAETIRRQLEIQAFQFDQIAQKLEADQKVITEYWAGKLRNSFASSAPLPENWSEQRRALLMANLNRPETAEQAAKLSAKMLDTFTALVEGRLNPEDLELAANDIAASAELIQLILDGGSAE